MYKRQKRYLVSESYTKDLNLGRVQLTFKDSKQQIVNELSVFPNPSKGLMDIAFANPEAEKVQILVYNFTGQLVNEIKNITTEKVQLDMTSHANGTYLLMLKRKDAVEVKRVILNR